MGETVIALRDISRVYKMGSEEVHALRGVSLEICKGDYIALMGPSGSGKSTLMNIIGCLDTPTSGGYVLNGAAVNGMSAGALARTRNKEIGFIFQTFNLLPRSTALENVALPLVYAGVGRRDRLERAREALSVVGLDSRVSHKPNELSGGQRQRVAIARALVNNPATLLADEPTGNLDSKNSEDIMAIFSQLHGRGHTIIVVTHDDQVAGYAERRVLFKDGVLQKEERSVA